VDTTEEEEHNTNDQCCVNDQFEYAINHVTPYCVKDIETGLPRRGYSLQNPMLKVKC